MSHIFHKGSLNGRQLNWEWRINSIVSEIRASAKPVPSFLQTGRSRSKCRSSGRMAGGMRKAMAFIERALPRPKRIELGGGVNLTSE